MASCGVLLRKTWLYGGAFWLLVQTRLKHPAAMALLLAVIGSVEVLQCWLPGRAPGTTDICITFLSAALVTFIDRRFPAETQQASGTGPAGSGGSR
jgi:VanZ family protein